jgi:hypothetical protein
MDNFTGKIESKLFRDTEGFISTGWTLTIVLSKSIEELFAAGMSSIHTVQSDSLRTMSSLLNSFPCRR